MAPKDLQVAPTCLTLWEAPNRAWGLLGDWPPTTFATTRKFPSQLILRECTGVAWGLLWHLPLKGSHCASIPRNILTMKKLSFVHAPARNTNELDTQTCRPVCQGATLSSCTASRHTLLPACRLVVMHASRVFIHSDAATAACTYVLTGLHSQWMHQHR